MTCIKLLNLQELTKSLECCAGKRTFQVAKQLALDSVNALLELLFCFGFLLTSSLCISLNTFKFCTTNDIHA